MEEVNGLIKKAEFMDMGVAGKIVIHGEGEIHHKGSVFRKDYLRIKIELEGKGVLDIMQSDPAFTIQTEREDHIPSLEGKNFRILIIN